MQEVRRRRAIYIGWRARLPMVLRVLALMLLGAGIIYIGVVYYKRRNIERFVMRGAQPELSRTETGRVYGYERRMMDGDRLRLLLRADVDITFTDQHHELENVHLEVYPPEGNKPDQINAQRSIYDPQSNIITFTGNVDVVTRDDLHVKTESIVYNQNGEVAETDAPVTFEHDNLSGSATGALIDAKSKHLELRNNVMITVTPKPGNATGIATGNATRNASGASVKPVSQPVVIHSAHAVVEQNTLTIAFTGGATAEQESDVMSADALTATLSEQRKVKKIDARGNAYLRTTDQARAAEVHSTNIEFFFNDAQQLEHAVATGEVRAQSLNADSQVQLTGANTVDVNFQIQASRSILHEMHTSGRSVVTMSAPQSHANDPRAANKRLTADSVKLQWRQTGRDLEHADADGNAELFIDPVQKTATSERKTLTAPHFDCDFFEAGNLAKKFTATDNVKAVIDPVQPTERRSTRTITSQKMVSNFVRETQDVESFEATGDVKFNEQDRNGRSQSATYKASDGVVHLRGGDPTVWDSRARMTATEIDSDTTNKVTYSRGRSQTTYYSREQTGGAAPFQKVNSPVYVTADRAEFHHDTGVGIYTGGARMWQDDNFVRADRITLYRDTKRLEGEGHVQSALYQAKRRESNGSTSVVPVFVTSNSMFYSDTDRLLHYDGSVDIKQGTDRITSATADVYLKPDVNEVDRTIAQQNVVLTQPGKRGTADWAQYTAADDTVILKGNPARVEDAEQGTAESGRLTVYLSENRVVADDTRGPQSAGRVHSTHKVRRP
ncbi:MAG TPA: LPS export ABC transporter periplasmic protein LptC [Pyrinomonadaceae bacterium]|nr:LPS export ABC transporter periplasmic protein LptC [Pyrinomonadaceae bacterium]